MRFGDLSRLAAVNVANGAKGQLLGFGVGDGALRGPPVDKALEQLLRLLGDCLTVSGGRVSQLGLRSRMHLCIYSSFKHTTNVHIHIYI